MGKHTRCIHHLHAFLLVLVHTSLVASTSRFRCPAEQAAALLRLKQSFQDPLLLPSWQARTDCCQWEGVSCDPDDASGALVAALNLSGYGLQNPSGLDRALLQLSSLRRLNLAGNDFGGASLPASGIEQLTELAHLNLSNAGFAGQIPTGFSSLTKLMSLDLSYNQGYTSSLSGAIPEFFADFRSLAILQLSNNDFNGSFPRGIFQLKSLRMLDLSSNPKLSGILPAELPARSSLEVLVLSETKFSGAIPSSIGNLKRLKILDIRDSTGRFSGGLPVSISDLKFLSFLDLSNSGLQIGELPDAISSLQSLSTLRLRDCGISGAIPSSIENLTRLSELDLWLVPDGGLDPARGGGGAAGSGAGRGGATMASRWRPGGGATAWAWRGGDGEEKDRSSLRELFRPPLFFWTLSRGRGNPKNSCAKEGLLAPAVYQMPRERKRVLSL